MPSPTENRAAVQAVRPTDKEVLDVLASAMAALKSCYDVATWPADGQTRQDGAIERAATLHARLAQSTEAVQPAFNPAWSDYTEAGSGFNEARDRLTGRLSRNSGVDWINVPKRDLEAVLRYQTAPSVSSEEGNDTEVAGLRVMTGADVLRVFRPLPEDELAALREVMPEIFGDADAGPDEGRAGDWVSVPRADAEFVTRLANRNEASKEGDRLAVLLSRASDGKQEPAPAQEAEETGGWLTIKLQRREDGGLRICSDEKPGLVLSGHDPQDVLADVAPALEMLGWTASPPDREGER